MNRKTELSVIIPTYNRAENLKECLGYIFKQNLDLSKFEIIIVDNGPSKDKTGEYVKKFLEDYPDNIVWIRTSHPGVTYARELGSVNARGDYHLQIDDDTQLIHPETFNQIIDNFKQGKHLVFSGLEEKYKKNVPAKTSLDKVGKVSGLGVVYSNYSDALYQDGRFVEVDHVRSCFLAYTDKIFKEVNGFDCYYDDLTGGMGFRGETDFCIKIKKKGYKIFLDKEIYFIHKGAVRPKRVQARGRGLKHYLYVYKTHSLFVYRNIKINKLKWFFYQLFIGDYRVPGLIFILKKKLNILLFFILFYCQIKMFFININYQDKK